MRGGVEKTDTDRHTGERERVEERNFFIEQDKIRLFIYEGNG